MEYIVYVELVGKPTIGQSTVCQMQLMPGYCLNMSHSVVYTMDIWVIVCDESAPGIGKL